MTNDELMSEISRHALRLHQLMSDPQPGLMSWGAMVGHSAGFIADWWEGRMSTLGPVMASVLSAPSPSRPDPSSSS